MARRKTKKTKLSPKATLLLAVLVMIYTLARPYLVPAVSIDEVPEYDGIPYVEIDGNQPGFEEKDLTEKSYESYSLLDGLGRCGAAVACIGLDLMPTGERESISSVYLSE